MIPRFWRFKEDFIREGRVIINLRNVPWRARAKNTLYAYRTWDHGIIDPFQ
jgi:hypothetical protein